MDMSTDPEDLSDATMEIMAVLMAPVPQWMVDFWEEHPGVMAYFIKLPDID